MTTQRSSGLLSRLAQGSLVKQILIGLVLGILLALVSKPAAEAVGLLGTLTGVAATPAMTARAAELVEVENDNKCEGFCSL